MTRSSTDGKGGFGPLFFIGHLKIKYLECYGIHRAYFGSRREESLPILRDGPDDRLDILGAPSVIQDFIETLDTRFGSIISATERRSLFKLTLAR